MSQPPNHLRIPPAVRHLCHIRGGPAFKALTVVSLMLVAVNSLSDLLAKLNQKEESHER